MGRERGSRRAAVTAFVLAGVAVGVSAGPVAAQTATTATTVATTVAPTTTADGTTTSAGTTTTIPDVALAPPSGPTTTEPPSTTATTGAPTTDPATATTDPPAPGTGPTTPVMSPAPTTTVDPTTSTTVDPTTTTTVPVDENPAAATAAPPVGAEAPPSLDESPTDPVAAIAQLTFAAFSPWRDAVVARSDARAALAATQVRAGATPEDVAAATTGAAVADAKVASLSLGYRFARDALADAVVARAGRPPADAVELSAIWERTDPKRLGVVFSALMQVGDDYVFATSGPDRFDCSGLTLYAWRTAGVSLVHYAITQRQQSLEATPETLLPGDLVFRFRQAGGHVMLYLGEKDLVVQAGGTATGVVVSPWGRTDAFGSPLAAPGPEPVATTAPVLFGAEATTRTVGADVPFADAFNVAGARYGVAPVLLAAIAATGTGYRTDAATMGAAAGVMQLRPAIAAELRVDPAIAFQAVDGAARRLADLWGRLHDARLVLAAYRTPLRTVNDGAVVPQDAASDTFAAAVLAAAG